MNTSDKSRAAMTTAGLNLIAQAISIYDSELRLAVCNSRFQEMFNLPNDLVSPGARFDDTIRHIAASGEYGPMEDIEEFVSARVEQALDFEPHYIERTRSNGQVISIEGAPLPQGGWVAVYTDISRTKRVEQLLRAKSEEMSDRLISHTEELSATNRKLAATITALEEAKRQLTEIEGRTRLTTEMMPAHIAHVDADGYYTYTNRRLSSVFPSRPSDILEMHISDALGPEAFAKIEPHLMAAYKGSSPVFEFTEVHDSRRIRVAFTPDLGGGVYILSMDVTEETQARVALQQARRREIAAQMTSGLAHDFSNLLTIILGMQGKLDKMELPAAAQEMVRGTLSAARRGGRLLNRIGEMTGQRSLRPQATNMHALLSELKILATPSLPQGVGLSVLDNTPDVILLLDAGKLQDALLNLILNARDACGVNGQITVSAMSLAKSGWKSAFRTPAPAFPMRRSKMRSTPFSLPRAARALGLVCPWSMIWQNLRAGTCAWATQFLVPASHCACPTGSPPIPRAAWPSWLRTAKSCAPRSAIC